MTTASPDALTETGDVATTAPAKRRGRHWLADLPPVQREGDELTGWPKAMARLLGAAVRGEIGTVVGRRQATSLDELRDALDAAIATAAEAGHDTVIAEPLEVVLAHYSPSARRVVQSQASTAGATRR